MTRGYWGGVMVFSLLVAGASGFYLYSALAEKNTVQVPLHSIPINPSAPKQESASTAPTETTTQTAVSTESIKPAEPVNDVVEEPKSNSSSNSKSPRNILFTFKRESAKEVFIVGSFNKWVREALERNEKGIWGITLKIPPGNYEYKLIVDGKKIRDPNNRLWNKEGNSILKVKPA